MPRPTPIAEQREETDERAAPSRAAHRRADARRNREAIVAAARVELRRDPAVSMDAVARAAGLSRSTLYRHFPTREDLTAALAARDEVDGPWDAIGVRDVRLQAAGGAGLILAAPAGASELQTAYLAEVRPPGQLGAERPQVVDATHVLNEVPPYLVAEQLVAEARRIAGVSVALYAVDVDGSHLFRLAGGGEFPAALEGPLSVGPEIAPDALPELYRRLEAVLPECHPYPMWLRGRAIGVLIAVSRPRESLAEVARQGTAALELADHYTDVFEVARRRRETSPAAEVQLNLLPARNAQVAGGELAGSLLPTYEVGGDWFDYTENPDGAWLAIADVAGESESAAALSSLPLGALRAARRSGEDLEGAVAAMDRSIATLGRSRLEMSTIVARWHAPTSTFVWVACGPIAPLRWSAEGRREQLSGRGYSPLGRSRARRNFERRELRLHPGDRIVLYTGGVSERSTADGGTLGVAGIERAVGVLENRSAAATARAIQEAVTTASDRPLEEDAAVVVLAVR